MSAVEPGQLDLPAGAPDSKFIRGKDGWLFLDQDSNRVIAQHTGELRFSPADLDRWQRVLENRIAWLGHRGIPYLFMVAPNAHVVYEEHLPDHVITSPERPLMQLMAHLERAGSEARILYPIEPLRRSRDRPVYPRTATHWTELGAFIAYEALVEEIGQSFHVPRVAAADVHWVEAQLPGDLGHKVEPVERSTFVYGDIRGQRAHLVSDNRVKRNGRRVEFEARARAGRTCLVVADSFAVRMVPFLAESFGRLVFAHISTLDYGLVEEVRPDIVITILSERFLIEVPEDVGAPTLRELEQEKRAAGEMLAPRRVKTNRLNAPR